MLEEYDSEDSNPLDCLIRDWIARHEGTPEPPPATAPSIAFYLRRSSADPLYFSIGAQLNACMAHAQSLGPEFDRERLLYVDRHRSGSTTVGREGLAEMLAAARAGKFRILAVRSIDRLTRSATDAARLYEILSSYGVSIHVAGKGEVQLFEILMLALSAQRERERMLEAIADGRRRAASRGGLFGTWSTYGYDRIEGPDWRINPEQAAILLRCFQELNSGKKPSELCRSLNAERIPAPGGGLWEAKSLFRRGWGALDRPILKGLFVWGIQSKKPVVLRRPDLSIVEADVFDAVNERAGVTSRMRKPRTRAPFLLGLVRCACGVKMRVTEDFAVGNMYCHVARLGGHCDRKKGLQFSVLARQVLVFFRDEILDADRGPVLEEIRRAEWQELVEEVASQRDGIAAEIERIGRELDALSPEDAEEIDPSVSAACCELELEHHRLSERSKKLVAPAFRALTREDAETDRASILRIMERLPRISRSEEDLRVIGLVRSILSEIELDIQEDGCRMRLWFGVPEAPSGLPSCGRSAERSPERWFPHPPKGPMRYPEVVLGHHRRAEAGAFSLDDDDWAAVQPVFDDVPQLRAGGRLAAEAILFVGATGLGPRYLPERYAPYASSMMGAPGPDTMWRRVFPILKARHSPIVADIGPANPTGKRPYQRKLAHPVPPLDDPGPWSGPAA